MGSSVIRSGALISIQGNGPPFCPFHGPRWACACGSQYGGRDPLVLRHSKVREVKLHE